MNNIEDRRLRYWAQPTVAARDGWNISAIDGSSAAVKPSVIALYAGVTLEPQFTDIEKSQVHAHPLGSDRDVLLLPAEFAQALPC